MPSPICAKLQTMWFGPFSIPQLEEIKRVLTDQAIPHETEAATEELEQKLEEWKSLPPSSAKNGPKLNTDHHYVHIEDAGITKLGHALERFGITPLALEPEPEFGDDFLCPRCEYHSTKQGWCPTHHVALITFEAFAEQKRTGTNTSMRWAGIIIAAVIAAFLVLEFLKPR